MSVCMFVRGGGGGEGGREGRGGRKVWLAAGDRPLALFDAN